MKRAFGYKEDRLRSGDLLFAARKTDEGSVLEGSLRTARRGRLYQGAANACVAFAFARALHMAFVLEGREDAPVPSPHLLYWLARHLEYTGPVGFAPPVRDEGSYPSLAVLALREFGFTSTDACPYDARRVNEAPRWTAFQSAFDQRGLVCVRLIGQGEERRRAVATALHSGLPVVFGMAVDEAFLEHEGPGAIRRLDAKRAVGAHMMTVLEVSNGGVRVDNWWENWGDEDGTALLSHEVFGSDAVRDVYALAPGPLKAIEAPA